jgi:parvulin-like peptidyl-prolyl isomerase
VTRTNERSACERRARRGLPGTGVALCLAALAGSVTFASPPQGDARPADDSGRVLVTVNGQPITDRDLEFLMVVRRIPEDARPRLRQPFLEQLIDARLMRAFLDSRKAQASPAELDAEVRRIRESIQRSGDDPDALLGRLGYTEQTLREELALPLAWRAYARLLITPERLREYYAQHRRRFDGTQLRASQVFLKAETDAERTAALESLRNIAAEIADKKLTFADAARQHSRAPSADEGGDVGWFGFRGRMPREFSRVAFALQPGEVSEPFATSFGVHLLTVTAERPGELSLEDVRREVFAELSEDLWDEIVGKQRAAAKIERKLAPGNGVEPDADRE